MTSIKPSTLSISVPSSRNPNLNILATTQLKKYMMAEPNGERRALTSRSIPHMKLSSGDRSSMTGPPLPMPYYISNPGRAVYRFNIDGNAICIYPATWLLDQATTDKESHRRRRYARAIKCPRPTRTRTLRISTLRHRSIPRQSRDR